MGAMPSSGSVVTEPSVQRTLTPWVLVAEFFAPAPGVHITACGEGLRIASRAEEPVREGLQQSRVSRSGLPQRSLTAGCRERLGGAGESQRGSVVRTWLCGRSLRCAEELPRSDEGRLSKACREFRAPSIGDPRLRLVCFSESLKFAAGKQERKQAALRVHSPDDAPAPTKLHRRLHAERGTQSGAEPHKRSVPSARVD